MKKKKKTTSDIEMFNSYRPKKHIKKNAYNWDKMPPLGMSHSDLENVCRNCGEYNCDGTCYEYHTKRIFG